MEEKKSRKSPVVSGGSYRLDREPVWVRPPSGVKVDLEAGETQRLEDENRVAAESAEAAAAAAAAAAIPTPEELARIEADRILAAARTEAEDLKRQGREQGYADGLKEGMDQGRAEGREEGLKELKDALERWLSMGDALAEAWKARFDGVETEATGVAVAAAEQLVQGHLALAPEAVLAVVKDCLRRAAEADLVTVLVAPKDVALVRAHRDELAGLLKGTGRFEILEEPKVEAGSCLVETKTQVIDATRATRLEGLKDAAREAHS
ncbi:MAG: FliH/SctL family protein [Candidatus Coatesbacteria bacterium]